MNASNIRGTLLEFLVRRLLANCGFFSVTADDIYTFAKGDLFFVNGRGAAHDADVLMEPPVQRPFTYPTRILYECKAYTKKVTLPIARNALGLRQDINEFEIVTKDSLLERKNNMRADYAIEKRNRYYYQVGVASTGGFSKPAVEFSANNKIPLRSMAWFLSQSTIDTFHEIDPEYVDSMDPELLSDIYLYLKDRSLKADFKNPRVRQFLRIDNKIGVVISSFLEVQGDLYIELIESGDIIFLRAQNEQARHLFQESQNVTGLIAQIHYSKRMPELWQLSVSTDRSDSEPAIFLFFIPAPVMERWRLFDLASAEAISIKEDYFSRIFIFNKGIRPHLPSPPKMTLLRSCTSRGPSSVTWICLILYSVNKSMNSAMW